jgi:hypothetical protein
MPCFSPANEFSFIEDNDRDSDTGNIPFLSWRLNVTDRPSQLVHDFTRYWKNRPKTKKQKKERTVKIMKYWQVISKHKTMLVMLMVMLYGPYIQWSCQILFSLIGFILFFFFSLASFSPFLHGWSENGIILCS